MIGDSGVLISYTGVGRFIQWVVDKGTGAASSGYCAPNYLKVGDKNTVSPNTHPNVYDPNPNVPFHRYTNLAAY